MTPDEVELNRRRAVGIVAVDINDEAWRRNATLDDPDGNGILLRGAVLPH